MTAVCSTANLAMVKSLGAHTVIDYTKEDFTKKEERYDIVFDAVGKATKSHCVKALAQNGIFLTVDGQGITKVRTEDLDFLKELMEVGQIKAVIDRRYSLAQVPEAHRHVETGRKKGNVVIRVEEVKKEN